MPSTIIDSAHLPGHLQPRDEMRHVWSDENRTAEVPRHRGRAGQGAGRARASSRRRPPTRSSATAASTRSTWLELRQQTERIGYPILGVVTQLNALCRDGLGEYCHWGATTQDITDTATVLQIREALDLVDAELDRDLGRAGDARAKEHRDTPMIGRSNLQQAIPSPSATRWPGCCRRSSATASGWRSCSERVLVGEFAGAAGTLASLETGAMETQAGLCAELGLAAAGDRLAHDPRQHRRGRRVPRAGRRHAGQAQHGRQADDADRGRRGLRAVRARPRLVSSTMPQKRNPISSCYIHAAISVVRQHAAALMDAMVADHERSTGPWEIEWIVLPEAFCLMAGALKQARVRRRGARGRRRGDAPQHRPHRRAGDERGRDDGAGPLHRPRVRARPGLRPLPRRGRAAAARCSTCSPSTRRSASTSTATRWRSCCDPANYLGQAGVMVDRVLDRLPRSTQRAAGHDAPPPAAWCPAC